MGRFSVDIRVDTSFGSDMVMISDNTGKTVTTPTTEATSMTNINGVQTNENGYLKEEVMDFSTTTSSDNSGKSINATTGNTTPDAFNRQTDTSSASKGSVGDSKKGTAGSNSKTKTQNPSGKSNINTSTNNSGSNGISTSGNSASNQSTSINSGTSTPDAFNRKLTSPENLDAGSATISNTTSDAFNRKASVATTTYTMEEMNTILKRKGFRQQDIDRYMNGEISMDSLMKEIEMDNARLTEYLEASYLESFGLEETKLSDVEARIEDLKTRSEKIDVDVLKNDELLKAYAEVYVMNSIMNGESLDTILSRPVYCTKESDGKSIDLSAENPEIKNANVDYVTVDLSKYITDDFVTQLKNNMNKTTVKGWFGKPDKEVYSYNSEIEGFANLYAQVIDNYDNKYKNLVDDLQQTNAELARLEYCVSKIKEQIAYRKKYYYSYKGKEDFEENSAFDDESLEAVKGCIREYITDTPYKDVNEQIYITNKEDLVLLVDCIANGKYVYCREPITDAAGVTTVMDLLTDNEGNKYFVTITVKDDKGQDFAKHFEDWVNYINDDERDVLNYIIKTSNGNSTAAYNFLNCISDQLDERWLNARIKQDEIFASYHPVAASAASVFTGPMEGMDALYYSISSYINGCTIRSTDTHSTTDIWRAEVANDILNYWVEKEMPMVGEMLAFTYSTGMSTLDSLALIGTTAVTGGATITTATLMGSRVYVSSLNDAKSRGLTDGQAIIYSLSAAAIETIMESYSLSHLMNLDKNISKSALEFIDKFKDNPGAQRIATRIVYGISQGLTGADEEFWTSVADWVLDDIISGDLSAYNTAIQNYILAGDTENEAIRKASKDFKNELIQSWASGLISEFCFGWAEGSSTVRTISVEMAEDLMATMEGNRVSEQLTFVDRLRMQQEMTLAQEQAYEEYKQELINEFLGNVKVVIGNIKTGMSTLLADNAGKLDLDGFKDSNNANISDKVDTKIFEGQANNSEYSSMKQVYDVLNAMIKSEDIETRTIAENIANIQNGNITDLFFNSRVDQYNKSAFAHYDRITPGSGSAFILNYWISNQITAHEFGHMLFDVLDYTKPTNYESVKAKTIENLTNNRQIIDDFLKEAIEYRQKFSAEEKAKITAYLQEHPEVLESMAEDIINNKAAIKQLCNEINLVDSKTELILSQFDNKEVNKLKNNLIALLKYRETIKGIYEAQLYDSEMQQIDMITGIIDSIYEGNNPYYDLYVQNGLRYHESSYFSKDAINGFNEQFADYTAIRVYSDDYAVARTFLENVLGNEWFNMMGSKYTEIANKITSNSIENFISNNSNNEAANTDSVEHTNASTLQGEKHNISPESRISELVNSINNVRCDTCGGSYDFDGKCESCRNHITSNSNVKNWIQELNTSLEGKNLTFEKDFDTIDNLAKISNLGIESVNRILNDTEYISKANKIIEYIHTNYQSVLSGNVKINTKFLANLITNNSNLLLNPKVKREVLDILMKDIAQGASYDIDTYQTIFTEFANIILQTDYPVKVVFTGSDILGECSEGRYNYSTGEIEIKAFNLVSKPYQTIITLFHEMTHHMQNIENFHKETLGHNQFCQLLDHINRNEFIEQYDNDAYYEENYGKNGLLLSGELEAFFTQYTTGFEYLQKLGIKLPDSLIAERNQKLKEINSNMADPYSFFRYYNGEEVDITEISRRLIENKPEYLSEYKQLNFIYKVENGKVVFKNSIDFENDYKAFKEGTLIWNGDFQEISDLYEKLISVAKSKEVTSIEKETVINDSALRGFFSSSTKGNVQKQETNNYSKVVSDLETYISNFGRTEAANILLKNYDSIASNMEISADEVLKIGQLEYIRYRLFNKYGERQAELQFSTYMKTGDAKYITHEYNCRDLASQIPAKIREIYSITFDREKYTIGPYNLQNGAQESANFFSNYGDYNNGTYGVDQACIEKLCVYEYNGEPMDYNEAKQKVNDAIREGRPRPSFEKKAKQLYFELKQSLINKGFTDDEASIILSSINDAGACSYASTLNAIFYKFRSNPDAFQSIFGYSMYRYEKGQKVLNCEKLLLDLYIYANDVENGGCFIQNGHLNENMLSTTIDVFGRQILNSEEQACISDSNGVKIDIINGFLASKNKNLIATTGNIYNNISVNILTQEIANAIVNNINVQLNNGKTIRMGYYSAGNTIRMYPLYDSNYDLESTDSWNEGGGHSVIVTGIHNNGEGLIVSSWGEEYIIMLQDLINGGKFRIDTIDILYKEAFSDGK